MIQNVLDRHGVTDKSVRGALEELLGSKRVQIVLGEGAELPVKATSGSAAYDLVLAKDTIVENGRFLATTNIRFKLPEGYAAIIKPRSGHTLKGMEVIDKYGNTTRIDAKVNDGVIDSDYRGIVGILMQSWDEKAFNTYTLKKGLHIAQMLIVKVEDVAWDVVDELDNTERGEGGYGHTDKN